MRVFAYIVVIAVFFGICSLVNCEKGEVLDPNAPREVELDQLCPALTHVVEYLLECRDVEVVLKNLPVGLEDDRKRVMIARHLEQVGSLAALEPEGRSRSGSPARRSCWRIPPARRS